MNAAVEAKKQDIAKILQGTVGTGTSVLIRGSISGFPARLQAISMGWPFGVMYFLETQVLETNEVTDGLRMVIVPRIGRGIWSMLSHIVLFEPKGMSVRDKTIESHYVLDYNDPVQAERFMHYPGMSAYLNKLSDISHFTEMQIRTGAGIYLAQPQSFKALNLDVCRETFRILGDIGQIIFEAFQ